MNLEDRMKKYYENMYRFYLTRRTPVIIRIDGCHFHTYTKHFVKPFDNIFSLTMQQTMKYLCENIQNCVLGYTQSDEISLVMCDYKNLNTEAWFRNNLNKIVSVSASLATVAFNNNFANNVMDAMYSCCYDPDNDNYGDEIVEGKEVLYNCYKEYYMDKNSNIKKMALFDSRAFNIPIEEVCNYFICRQQDAIKNSVQMLGRSHFSDKELYKVNGKQIQNKLLVEHNVNWNDISTKFKRGSCCIKTDKGWVIDDEIPIFTEDRSYIERCIIFKEENNE